MKRVSFFTYSEAQKYVDNFCSGIDFPYHIEEVSGDYSNFPCPPELKSWGDEVCIINVIDEEQNEVILSVAYWE